MLKQTNLQSQRFNKINVIWCSHWASQVTILVKNPPANAEDMDSIPGSGRSPGGGHGNPLQHSCLENPMDRGAWWAIVHGVAKSQAQLKRLSVHASTLTSKGLRGQREKTTRTGNRRISHTTPAHIGWTPSQNLQGGWEK